MSPIRATPEDEAVRLTAVALNRAADGKAPEWMQLLPAGERLEGRDGRSWGNDPAAVLDAFARHGAPIAIDFEHAQYHKAPVGDAAPAAAWIEEMQERDGAIWGRVDWTPKGRRAVESREYRFFSPEICFDPATLKLEEMLGGGLVNRPNFRMAALNRQNPEGTPSMKTIAAALGLPETATEQECAMALAALKAEKATALNAAAAPDLTKFVPRADLETALNRASAAETKLREAETAGQDKAITAAVDGAVAAGKIAPASRDFYVATCRAGGLAAFQAHLATLPSLFTTTGLSGKDPAAAAGAGTATALNAEQRASAKAMGIDETKFAAWLAARAADAAKDAA